MMALNIERFKNDLQKLLDEGVNIQLSLLLKIYGNEEITEILGVTEEQKRDAFENLPAFNVAYESWYSEAIVVIRQLLPHRLQDFKDHFESPKNRKDINYASYRIQDAIKGIKVTRSGGSEVVVDDRASVPHFEQQIAILKAVQKRFESSLFEIRQLVQADLFDHELDAARELLKNNFLRAAGAIAGVLLEKHLRQVCEDHSIKIAKKNPGISDLNELLKAATVIDVPQWRHITLLGDYRNICDHNKQKEPTFDQVTDLIDGTDKVLKTIA